jgi:hypothetical protein
MRTHDTRHNTPSSAAVLFLHVKPTDEAGSPRRWRASLRSPEKQRIHLSISSRRVENWRGSIQLVDIVEKTSRCLYAWLQRLALCFPRGRRKRLAGAISKASAILRIGSRVVFAKIEMAVTPSMSKRLPCASVHPSAYGLQSSFSGRKH